MTAWIVFRRLILRPLLRDWGRTALTTAAVALGVAAVVAVDLAAEASAGSFEESIETLSGRADLEVSAIGGLREELLADLAALPHPLRLSPRVEGFARIEATGETVPVFGLDLIGDATLEEFSSAGEFEFEGVTLDGSAWVGAGLASEPGGEIKLLINDRPRTYRVQGVLPEKGFAGASTERVVVLDIAEAQRALAKLGLLDRVQIITPDQDRRWREVIREALPAGVEVEAAGAGTEENRKMLGAFRWNLRVLSYLSLIVGALLIFNTISVSVLRRRVEIGVLRALGAERRQVRWAFLAEAAFFGAAGTAVGVAAGRLLADGAVDLMARTVQTLYVSARPGEIEMPAARWLTAAAAGLGVALLSAWAPAAEAARAPPVEAMNRGARDYSSRLNVGRNLALGALLALAAALCCLAPPIAGKPLFGYLASVLLLAASACAAPAAVRASSRLGTRFAGSLLGVEGFLASRSIGAALSRTAVLVAALSTAVAMMVSIAVLVGSFRETILLWMDRQLQADLYIRPAGEPAFDRFPTLAGEVAERVAEAPGVARVDRFRAYPIRYDGAPAVLGVGDVAARSGLRFLEGGSAERILERLRTGDNVIVSEPFARKHEVWTGDRVRLPLRGRAAEFVVAGVYYDYASERGAIIGDRRAFSKYLPDDDVSSLAIVLEPGADPDRTRERITEATAGRELYIVSNARIRREAAAIFDRTFAITYALEAVAVITAILGMAGGLTALVIDRKRELAVLRFLGASGSQIQKLIFAESGLLALLSAGLGAGLGAALSLVLVFVINRQSFGWTIQWHWPTAVVAAALGAVVLSALPAGVSPARAARRMDPIEAVREG